MSEIINKPIGIRCADIYLRFPEIMEDECDDLAEFLEDEHIVYEGATDIFIDQKNKLNKQKEVLDKIKEILNKTNNLTLDETGYKEYLKSNFIKDKDIFKTICHLEDFELVYGEILELLEEIE